MGIAVGDIADRFGLRLEGDSDGYIDCVTTLKPGQPQGLAYLADDAHLDALRTTKAGAVIVSGDYAGACPTTALIADDPRLVFAHAAGLFLPPSPPAGIAHGALVDSEACVDPSASIAAGAIVEAGACIGAGTVLEAGAVVGRKANVGDGCLIEHNAVIGSVSHLESCVRVGGGAVIGGRGFGLVQDEGRHIPIPQLGRVVLGHDVEIGAGCTIDRGAIEDTVLAEGVKLDDQVHIGHNTNVGPHTVIAGYVAIAGSCNIGSSCMIGGAAALGDHVTIPDGTMITGGTQVPSSISQPGVYSSTLWPMPARDWQRNLASLRKLDRTNKRVRALEKKLRQSGETP